MEFEQLATKDDLKGLHDAINALTLKQTPSLVLEKIGMTSSEVCKALGGVSCSYLESLRKKNILFGKKIGGNWIYNYQQVMDFIPDYKK